MGIINFIRKMHKFVSAALLAFVASAQAGFLTEDYADEGRNLRSTEDLLEEKICGKGYKKREMKIEKRDMKIEDLKETFCRVTTYGAPDGVKLVCKDECVGDKYVGPSVRNRSYMFYEARDEFCGICCNDDEE